MNTQIVITLEDKFYDDIDESDIIEVKIKLIQCLDEHCPCNYTINIRKEDEN